MKPIVPCLFVSALLVISLFPISAHCQQHPVISSYMKQPLLLSPAAVGIDSSTHLDVTHRSQWRKYDNFSDGKSGPASQLQMVTASMQLRDSAGGLGLLVYRDEAGPLQTFDMKVSYGYHIRYTKKGTIGLGAGVGVRAKTMDYNDYIVKHPDDALLGEGAVTQIKPDLSLGVWLNHEKYYFGGSYAHFLGADYDQVNVQDEALITITGGYHFQLDKNWKVTPGFLLMNEASQTTFAIHTLGTYRDLFEGGISYRHEEAFSVLMGTRLLKDRSLRLVLATDMITENKGAKGNASFEVILGYRFL
ncbi:PorP/SprF family type IX secretion system membrane protein [Fulvivirgaceae bacterium PWU5]|uniref:PorP/SprF family type IX secretion system membrane protein n=1 Tax=Dawidia cretensis TaxID=2782350 RepID=A0AAP2GTG0_9BACT|nr:PorP/SprF family type IX secretion system membrane protein [Dawidia cretensis]MBT1707355.1 PorP/SprF family type IX secretion system membrane protein [Dawidia cretensis]